VLFISPTPLISYRYPKHHADQKRQHHYLKQLIKNKLTNLFHIPSFLLVVNARLVGTLDNWWLPIKALFT